MSARRIGAEYANPSGVNIRIKVQGGTLGDKFLCESCQFGTVMRGPSMQEIQVRCSGLDGPPAPVPFRVVQCNRYLETDSTDLRQMKRDAYYVHKTASGGCHAVTRAQLDDYEFIEKLERSDAKKLSQRSRTIRNPKRQKAANGQ